MPDTTQRAFTEQLHSLDLLLAETWVQLQRGATSASHGWHLPVLGSIEEDQPRTRMVVLRGCDQRSRSLWCHTDRRSSKISNAEANRLVSWLFYDSKNRAQLSVHATATVHTDDAIADAGWEASRLESLRCYLAPERPGLLSDEATVNLPDALITRPPTADEAAAGRENFAIFRTEVTSLELLVLKQSGNVRARFTWDGTDWAKSWVTP